MHPLELELEQAMTKLHIQDKEQQDLHAHKRKLHSEGIDRLDNTLFRQTRDALEQANHNREALRRDAEACLERWVKEQEEERRRREEEERLRREAEAQAKAERDRKIRQEQERLAREKEEALRKEREQKERVEQERARIAAEAKKKEEDRRKQEEERRIQEAQRQKLEADLEADRQKAEADRQRVEADQQQKAELAKQRAKQAGMGSGRVQQIHMEYLDLYEKIKKWKNDYWTNVMEKARGNYANKKFQYPEIKEKAGDLRRAMRGVNALTAADKETNKVKISQIKEAIKQSLTLKTPHIGQDIPVNFFLPASLQLNDNNQATITDLGAFTLACFVQSVCKVFMESAPHQPENAEPVGTLLSSVFAMKELQFQRTTPSGTTEIQTIFPMLLAKYHKVCPILFGITADQNTLQGKRAIGWQLVKNDDGPKTTFVTENAHYDRQIGLAIGYSSFGLRNFAATTTMRNPYPPIHFWRSLAQIINLPPEQVTPTHLAVLKNIFGKDGIRRFLLFFGAVGLAVVREAYIHFPERLPAHLKANTFWKEIWVYARDKLREDNDLTLEFAGR